MEEKYLYIGTVEVCDVDNSGKNRIDKVFGFFDSWMDFCKGLNANYDDSEIISIKVKTTNFDVYGGLGILIGDARNGVEDKFFEVLSNL